MKRLLIFLIHCYQGYLSPLLGKNCRYLPTCSEYAVTALERHGVLKGSLLAVWRIMRCNPLGGSGFDPVPPKEDWLRPFRLKKGRGRCKHGESLPDTAEKR